METFWFIALVILAYYIFNLEDRSKDGGSSSRKLTIAYLVWAVINLVMLLVSNGDGDDFWPSGGSKSVNDYDLSEFMVYVFGPLVFGFARGSMMRFK
jgi:hypothetical protein